MSRRFVLLDRDGTITEEIGYVLDPSELRLLPSTGAALRRLRELGLGVAAISNQSPIGRGLLSPETLDAIHARLAELLEAEGIALDGIYVCPHVPDAGCHCRKPRPGLALRAAAELGFDPDQAIVVGDHASDMGLARAIGATGILVRTGHGEEELERGARAEADAVVDHLGEAAELIAELVGARAQA